MGTEDVNEKTEHLVCTVCGEEAKPYRFYRWEDLNWVCEDCRHAKIIISAND